MRATRFGDIRRTLPLLLIFVRGKANVEQVARCILTVDKATVRHSLYFC